MCDAWVEEPGGGEKNPNMATLFLQERSKYIFFISLLTLLERCEVFQIIFLFRCYRGPRLQNLEWRGYFAGSAPNCRASSGAWELTNRRGGLRFKLISFAALICFRIPGSLLQQVSRVTNHEVKLFSHLPCCDKASVLCLTPQSRSSNPAR